MPFGTLDLSKSVDSMPLHAPAYAPAVITYSNTDILSIKYKTSADSVKHLIPSELELLSETPSAYVAVVNYGMSSFGAYTEFIQCVQVKYRGVEYNYNIALILANEAAIYAGREVYGFPKVYGQVEFDTNATKTGFIAGSVERPQGVRLGHFGFRASHKIQDFGPVPRTGALGLNLRCIPNGVPGQPPALREFYPFEMEITQAEIWSGTGSATFTGTSDFDPLHKVPVVEYESATLIRGANAILHPAIQTFPI